MIRPAGLCLGLSQRETDALAILNPTRTWYPSLPSKHDSTDTQRLTRRFVRFCVRFAGITIYYGGIGGLRDLS